MVFVMMFGFGIICCTLSQFIGEPKGSFFSTDTAVIHSVGQYLRTYSIRNGFKQYVLG